jgi:hypothetical protein
VDKEAEMFGTVGHAHIKEENKQKLTEALTDPSYQDVPGYRRGYLMFPENREGEVVIVAVFEDADSYWKNANDPAQHDRYMRYRALLEDEPQWSDGEWIQAPEGTA